MQHEIQPRQTQKVAKANAKKHAMQQNANSNCQKTKHMQTTIIETHPVCGADILVTVFWLKHRGLIETDSDVKVRLAASERIKALMGSDPIADLLEAQEQKAVETPWRFFP